MDEYLLKRVKDGDPMSFRQLYNRYVDKALRVATAMTRNKELAKDAVQETFIRVYKNIDRYDLSKPFDPWFYKILTNECNRLLQKESKTTPFDLSELDYDSEHLEEVVDYSDLYQAIQALKDIYRIPIILKYLKGFSEKEIAEILELKQNTVKTRLYQGRDKLKQVLEFLKRRESHV